jgi:nicotinamidase-related amidase
VTSTHESRWQAVVLVDMQVDFFNDPELERCRADLVATCNKLIAAALERGLPVIEVRTVHAADGSTWALNMLEDESGMVIEGSAGADPVDGLTHAGCSDGIVVVRKTRDSAFHRTELHRLLRERAVEAFLLCGVSTESCVAATAIDAYAHDLRVGIVADATASVRWDLHDQTLESLKEQYRQPAISSERAIATLA